MPFIDKLKYWATAAGGRPAIVVGDQRLSYAQLLVAAESAGTVGPGVSVIDVPDSTALAVEFCAALLQGRTAMVVDAGWPHTVRQELADAAAQWQAEQWQAAQRPGKRALHAKAGAAPFLLGLSSGTSGLPKAFVRETASWRDSFLRSTEYFNVSQEAVTLAPGPMAASMNLYAMGESWFAGGTHVSLPRFSADATLRALGANPVNRLVLVPTILELIASRGLQTGQSGEQIRSVVCAGSTLSAGTLALARAWAPHARIQQYYGAAELGFVAVSTLEPAAAADDTPGQGVGGAFPGVHIAIRQPDGDPVAPGQQGDVHVQSPYVCSGYAWGDDGLAFSSLPVTALPGTAQPNTGPAAAAPWHTVHDRGWLDEQDNLHLAGRASDMIVTSGSNVYPHHVEQLLTEAPGCGDATIVVAGIADAVRGQRVVAGIHAPADRLAMIRRAATGLPAAQRPSHYFELASLPLTGSGKISRRMLAQWIMAGDPRARRIH